MEPWKVILTDTALADLDSILDETLSQFGNLQLRRYTKQIQNALQELEANGLNAPLLKDRGDIQPHLLTYPLSRKGKRSPHHLYLRFDVKGNENSVIILRILHERMDPETQIKEAAQSQ
ncbi:Toxin ParE [Marinobacter litoralis]|uniref:Toxin ParE n=1 Tax=Marinobacter litoralis TaxID=187981 RepID=A0A3M2RGD8_9GAMM|nr:type II toxin-antitoxin system RelE/ParE family toxin [Marinobacter litoralis]RMJ04219.1 Toxin ParE [Marinobacter litoralis]